MIFKNFNGKQETHKDEKNDLTLDEEFEQIFFNPKDSVLNNNTDSDENNNNNNTKNNSNNSKNNNYDLDMNDFIFFSEDEQDELESKNSQPPSRSIQSHDKFTVSPYNEYISPVSFSNHSLNTLTTKESSAAVLGRKTYLDSAYKKFSNSTHSLMFRNESITSNIHLPNNTNNSNCLSSQNSNTNSVITPQSGFYSPEKKVFPLQNSPCFDSQRIAEHEDLKRRKRTILADKLSSRFRSSSDHREEKDITIVKKEGRIHKMISNFTNKQKKTTPTTLDNNSNNNNEEEEEEEDNVKSNNDNNNKNNLNNSNNNGGRAVSETSTLKTRTRNNSQFSLSAGSEKHLMNTMFKMSHISQRPNSNSISSTTTANSMPEQQQQQQNNNINHQQLKPDLDLELNDASLAFKLARTRTKSGGNNINMGSQ